MTPTVTFSKMQLYADDTQCIKDIHSRSDSDLLQDDLDQLSNWSSIWEMDFNTDKCVSMSFGKAVHHSTYTLNKSVLKSVTEHKDVGVLLTSKLSFSKHLKNILAKAHRSLDLLRRVILSNSNTTLKCSLYFIPC